MLTEAAKVKSNCPDSLVPSPAGAARHAMAEAFHQCRRSLLRYVAGFTQQPHDIEDIVQESFLRCYAAASNTTITAPQAYLFEAAHNLAIKHLRRAENRLTAPLDPAGFEELLVEDLSAERRLFAQEHLAVFCEAVRLLSPQCRRAFILRKVYGLKCQEIAERLGISVKTVERHLTIGICRCNAHLRSRGYTGFGSLRHE